MKIGIVGDVHWSKYSSIVRSRGKKYSTRLENCIDSINWAESLFDEHSCDLIVYLGDFFDSSDLSAEEIAALSELTWSKTQHYFLIGNHEMGLHDLSFSSGHVFKLCENSIVIDNPCEEVIDNVNIVFLPYILESERKPIEEYVSNKDSIVFSHNDLKGVQLGKVVSNIGFLLSNIEDNCSLFINGHLHNGSNVSDKIINLGNLTGQNFSEDALKYAHHISILDTNNMSMMYFENPYALNFLKFDSENDSYKTMLHTIKELGNVVCTIKIKASEIDEYANLTELCVAGRYIIQPEFRENTNETFETLSVNHLEKFKEYILNELGNDEVVVHELNNIVN